WWALLLRLERLTALVIGDRSLVPARTPAQIHPEKTPALGRVAAFWARRTTEPRKVGVVLAPSRWRSTARPARGPRSDPVCAHARARQSGHCRPEYSARGDGVKAAAVWSRPRPGRSQPGAQRRAAACGTPPGHAGRTTSATDRDPPADLTTTG